MNNEGLRTTINSALAAGRRALTRARGAATLRSVRHLHAEASAGSNAVRGGGSSRKIGFSRRAENCLRRYPP